MADGTLKVGTITTSSGSGTITIPSGVSMTGHMYPAFEAYLSSTQTVTDATATKVQFDTEVFDTHSTYDNSTNYRFTVPSDKAGKYFIYAGLQCYANAVSTLARAHIQIYKNGSIVRDGWNDPSNNYGRFWSPTRQATMDLAVGDYIEIYTIIDVTSGSGNLYSAAGTEQGNYFGAYRLGA